MQEIEKFMQILQDIVDINFEVLNDSIRTAKKKVTLLDANTRHLFELMENQSSILEDVKIDTLTEEYRMRKMINKENL